MRLTVLIVEATADEMGALPDDVRALLQSLHTSRPSSSGERRLEPASEADGTLPPELTRFITREARSKAARDLVAKFAAEVLKWEGTYAVVGKSSNSEDGFGHSFRFMLSGTPYGGFVYVHPGTTRLDFRLGAEYADRMNHVNVRRVKDDDKYKVSVRLQSEEALVEAIDLARAAIDAMIAEMDSRGSEEPPSR